MSMMMRRVWMVERKRCRRERLDLIPKIGMHVVYTWFYDIYLRPTNLLLYTL